MFVLRSLSLAGSLGLRVDEPRGTFGALGNTPLLPVSQKLQSAFCFLKSVKDGYHIFPVLCCEIILKSTHGGESGFSWVLVKLMSLSLLAAQYSRLPPASLTGPQPAGARGGNRISRSKQ